MRTLSYSDARKHLAEAMEQVCDDHAPILITRQRARPVVIMSLEDYNSLDETAYLVRSPANARELRESIAQAEKGKLRKRKLSD